MKSVNEDVQDGGGSRQRGGEATSRGPRSNDHQQELHRPSNLPYMLMSLTGRSNERIMCRLLKTAGRYSICKRAPPYCLLCCPIYSVCSRAGPDEVRGTVIETL